MLTDDEIMRPYLAYFAACQGKGDLAAAATAIAVLPKEKRYLYRIFQSLDWGTRRLRQRDSEVGFAVYGQFTGTAREA
jgi:hypothetical protein